MFSIIKIFPKNIDIIISKIYKDKMHRIYPEFKVNKRSLIRGMLDNEFSLCKVKVLSYYSR